MPTQVYPLKDNWVGFLIVGQGAGWQEEQNKIPWCGKAGQLCREICKEIAIELEPVGLSLTNTVRCRLFIMEDGKKQDRVPTDDELSNCIPYLKRDILKVNPKILVLAGAHAAGAFGYGGSVASQRGKIRSFNLKDGTGNSKLYKTIVIFHPAAALRDPSKTNLIKKDLTLVYNEVLATKIENIQLTLL